MTFDSGQVAVVPSLYSDEELKTERKHKIVGEVYWSILCKFVHNTDYRLLHRVVPEG